MTNRQEISVANEATEVSPPKLIIYLLFIYKVASLFTRARLNKPKRNRIQGKKSVCTVYAAFLIFSCGVAVLNNQQKYTFGVSHQTGYRKCIMIN